MSATPPVTVAALRARGCPPGMCHYYWTDGTRRFERCTFNHDRTIGAVGNGAGGGGSAAWGSGGTARRVIFGTGGGFLTQGGQGAGGEAAEQRAGEFFDPDDGTGSARVRGQ